MKLTNPWVGYLTRSYQQIKKKLLERLVEKTPEITDHSESNPLIILLSMFAGLTEMLNYYIDNMAREAFLESAREYESVVKLGKQIDYRIKPALSASADIKFSFLDGDDELVELAEPFTIPAGIIVKTSNGVKFTTVEQIEVAAGESSVIVPTKQFTLVEGSILGETSNLANQTYSLPTNYADGNMQITINDIAWEERNTLALSAATDKHYVVTVNSSKIPYIQFGDGVYGAIPPSGFDVIADYRITQGKIGNDLLEETITILESELTPPDGVTTISVTNKIKPNGGSDLETIEQIRFRAPLSLRTLDTAKTYQDFKDLGILAPGVSKVELKFDIKRGITIYIVPEGGGIASNSLIESTEEYFDEVRLVGTKKSVQAAGVDKVVCLIEAQAKFRKDPVQAAADIVTAFKDHFSQENQDINKSVRISDLIALIDNLEKIDFLSSFNFYINPYARPLTPNENQLDWDRETLTGSTTKTIWRLRYLGSDEFRVIKNNTEIGTATTSEEFSDGSTFKFTINSSAGLASGDKWQFVVYPYNRDMVIEDFTIPEYDVANSNIQVTANNSITKNKVI